jgi:hypothetical protein
VIVIGVDLLGYRVTIFASAPGLASIHSTSRCGGLHAPAAPILPRFY